MGGAEQAHTPRKRSAQRVAQRGRRNNRIRPGGAGGHRLASLRLPEPPSITVPVRGQTRIEWIPLTDADPAGGGAGGAAEQEYAVVLHTVPPMVAAGTGPAEQVAVSTTDSTSAEDGAATGEAGGPATAVDDDPGIVHSVN